MIEKYLKRFATEKRNSGYTLLELVITLTILAIMVMGTLPIAQTAVRRQREMRLRQVLRDIRNAVDEFRRDAGGSCPLGSVVSGNPTQQGQNIPIDPRSRVVIDDCTIFDTENLDRYPPSLEVLVEGVRVKARGLSPAVRSGGVFDSKNATELNEQEETIKVYLRELPVDPITGKADWVLRSSYQPADAGSWDEVNVFDVRSASDMEALNGEKYSDW